MSSKIKTPKPTKKKENPADYKHTIPVTILITPAANKFYKRLAVFWEFKSVSDLLSHQLNNGIQMLPEFFTAEIETGVEPLEDAIVQPADPSNYAWLRTKGIPAKDSLEKQMAAPGRKARIH